MLNLLEKTGAARGIPRRENDVGTA
jgi:hypothetical protein